MVHPSWWAVVWIQSEGDGQDVVRVDDWGGVVALRAGLLGEASGGAAISWDVFDHRGRMVLGYDGVEGLQTTMATPPGAPVMMSAPMVEGRWLWHEDGTYTREKKPPTRRVVEWVAQAEMRDRAEGDVLVTPYDLDPNPVSIAMRLRKRIFNEQRDRESL